MNVSHFIANYLEKKKIKNIFLVTGGGMMFLTDALSKSKINLIFNHHEQASFFSTDGYTRSSQTTGVCFATSGPGITNLTTGILSAWQDSTPIIIIGGQCKLRETIQYSKNKKLRQYGTFEANSLDLLKPITKFSKRITNPNSVKYYLDKAFYVANEGRPGPVFLEIPLDIQAAIIDKKKILNQKFIKPKKNKQNINLRLIENKLNLSKKPIILAGYGVRASKSVEVFRDFIKKNKIPVITTQFAKDVMYYSNNFFIGHCGPKGDRAANIAIQNADLILVIGSSLHSQTIGWEHKLFAPKAYKIQVDVDSFVLKKKIPNINLRIKCEISYFVKKLLSLRIKKNIHGDWLNYCTSLKDKFQIIKEPHLRNRFKLNYYDLIFNLSGQLPKKSTIVTDAGAAYYILGQVLNIKKGQRFITPASQGTMGYALSAANGSAVFNKNKNETICITGDGSIMTNIHDLSVTYYNKLNVKIFIINNSGYMSIRNSQKEFFKGNNFGTDNSNGLFIVNFKEMAKIFKISYYKCCTLLDLKKIIKKVFNKKKPVIIDCHVLENQIIMPSLKSKLSHTGKFVAEPLDKMYPYLNKYV
jgi:acetolactate synthase-1/2/3 large subunit